MTAHKQDEYGLSVPPDGARLLRYRDDLPGVRAFAGTAARQAGLSHRRADDFVLAISELASNTLAHTESPGVLTLWTVGDELVGQVSDVGHITVPRPGQVRPSAGAVAGHGLWLVHQLCDHVRIRTGPNGTTIQVRMRLGSR